MLMSSETAITFALYQFIILIVTIVGAALSIMGFINNRISKIDKKIAVFEERIKHLQEGLKDRSDRLRDIEKVIIPTGMSNISDVKEAVNKALKETKEKGGSQ